MWELPVDGRAVFDPSQLQVTAVSREAISRLKQGSSEWLRARYGRLTASNFGAAAGNHLPGARRKLLETMLWPETHRLTGYAAKFAAYGTENESVAREIYITDRNSRGKACVRVYETGLLVSITHGWLGSSPDFIVDEVSGSHERPAAPITNPYHCRAPYVIVHACGARHFIENTPLVRASGDETTDTSDIVIQGCGEIKCPAAKALYSCSEKHAKYAFPAYYYDQIQGVMAINNWPWCDTVVYTPQATEVIRFHADAVYWEFDLFPKLKRFYFEDFLPRLALRMQGVLKQGEVDARLEIPACVLGLGIDMALQKKRKRSSSKRGSPDEEKDESLFESVN